MLWLCHSRRGAPEVANKTAFKNQKPLFQSFFGKEGEFEGAGNHFFSKKGFPPPQGLPSQTTNVSKRQPEGVERMRKVRMIGEAEGVNKLVAETERETED